MRRNSLLRDSHVQGKDGSEGGFTLVELLVVMIIVGILSLTLANFITTWLQASSLSQARTSLLTNAETALDAVTNDVKLSGSVDQNNRWPDANGPGGSQFGWTSGSQVLVLAKAATDSGNNIIFSDPAKYISQKDNEIYYLSGTTLYRRTLASTSSNDASYDHLSAGQCVIDLSGRQNSDHGRVKFVLYLLRRQRKCGYSVGCPIGAGYHNVVCCPRR